MKIEKNVELNEGRADLAQGVFWIVDLDDIESNRDYCFPIYSDADGNTLSSDYELNAKSGSTYNHERLWKELGHKKPYNYYPRGRVQIANGKATIFLNPNIYTEEIINFIINEFKLYRINGINKVNVVADGSNHYKCFLDK